MHKSDIYNYNCFRELPFDEVATIAAFGAEAAVSHTSLVGLRQIRIHFADVMRLHFQEIRFLQLEFSKRAAEQFENCAKLLRTPAGEVAEWLNAAVC